MKNRNGMHEWMLEIYPIYSTIYQYPIASYTAPDLNFWVSIAEHLMSVMETQKYGRKELVFLVTQQHLTVYSCRGGDSSGGYGC